MTLARVTTTRALLPGEAEAFSVPYVLTAPPVPGVSPTFRVWVNDPSVMPAPGLSECDVSDNSADTTANCVIFG